MVNSLSMHQKSYSLYSVLLDKINQKINKINLPEFIINYNEYQRWPKRLYKYYSCLQKQSNKMRQQIPVQIRQRIQTLLTKIYDRLMMLGEYGNLLKKKLEKEVDYFCSALKSSNYTTKYSPSQIDDQLLKIIQYHQKKRQLNKYKINSKFENNALLAQFQERLKTFHELQKENSTSPQFASQCINYLASPQNHIQMHVNRTCLHCTTFFSNNSSSVIHSAASFYSVDAYGLSSYEAFVNIQSNVKASICTMLNEPSGGVVLLGCERQGTLLIPKGFHITQKQKDSLQQKIQCYFLKISPKVRRNQQVFIDFVPMMELKQSQVGYGTKKYQYEPLKGIFICRIFLLPKQSYKIYLLKASADHSTLQARSGSQSITVPQSLQYSFLINKFDAQYDSRLKCGIISSHYNIKCFTPHTGQMAYEKKSEEYEMVKQIETSEDSRQPQFSNTGPTKKAETKVKVTDIANKRPEDYKLWTLVVGDRMTMNRFQEVANQKQEKGIKFQQMFADSKYKLTKTTWVMFHEDKFELMKKVAEKYNIQYKGKELKMIASSLYLQIQNGIYEGHYQMLYEMLQTKPDIRSTIKAAIQKQNQGKNIWILWFESLKGSIYAYYYLSDLGYKVRFIRGANHFKDHPQNNLESSEGQMQNNDSINYGSVGNMSSNIYYGNVQPAYQPQSQYNMYYGQQQQQPQGYQGYPYQSFNSYGYGGYNYHNQ